MEIRKEHDEMQNNGRKLVTDLLAKEEELKALRSDFDRIMGENGKYRRRFNEQEEALK